jgi:SecD/SecF fusion protein
MKKLVFITITFTFTLLILAACTSNNSEKKYSGNPVKIEFFETYSLQDIQSNWTQAIELSKIKRAMPIGTDQDSTVSLSNENNSLPSLESLVKFSGSYDIGFVKEENIAAVDEILSLPEIKELFPPDLKFMWSYKPEDKSLTGGEGYFTLYAIKVPGKRDISISGKHITDATVSQDEASRRVYIELTMTEKGSELWAEMTTNNLEKCIAIALDGRVMSAPRVMGAITGGNTQISGSFTIQEAEELAGGIMAGR